MESKIKTRRIQLFVRVLLTLNQQDPIISLRGKLGPIKQVFPRTHFIAVSVLSQERERERERERGQDLLVLGYGRCGCLYDFPMWYCLFWPLFNFANKKRVAFVCNMNLKTCNFPVNISYRIMDIVFQT